MKLRRLCCVTLLIAVLFPASSASLAQDVAAAARANRASHSNAASVNPDNEWYSPTHASIHAQSRSAAATILYEISGQDLKITMDTEEKGKKQVGEIMVINGRGQWMLAKNVPLEKGYEIDALDGAVLNLKLALELLRAAAPAGPNGIKQKTAFDSQGRQPTNCCEYSLREWRARSSMDLACRHRA